MINYFCSIRFRHVIHQIYVKCKFVLSSGMWDNQKHRLYIYIHTNRLHNRKQYGKMKSYREIQAPKNYSTKQHFEEPHQKFWKTPTLDYCCS